MLKPHQYQEEAVEFSIKVGHPFLAIDMGLGKTLIKLLTLKKLGIPALIIAPINPMYNTWPDEIEKWKIGCTYNILHGPNKREIFEYTNADILLINYDGIKWLNKTILESNRPWRKRALILDESSMIKSHSTQRFKLLKKMNPLWLSYRSCLSATPSPNGYHELWTQYYILDKGKTLGSAFTHYRSRFFNYTGPPVFKTSIKPGSTKEIEQLIRPITFRLESKDYIDMPEYIHNEIKLEFPSKLFSQYKQLETEFFLEFDSTSSTAFSAATLSMKLRQFIQGAIYTDEKDGSYHLVHSLKVDQLKQLVELSIGQPILCPIQFKFELKLIREAFKYEVPCIAGQTTPKEARTFITQWNEGKLPLLLCHPASLSHGVNLQNGGFIIVWFGIPWSLEQYKQLNGRIYRQGQKRAVVINHLVIKNTIDERIMKVLAKKEATMQTLLTALKRR